ncbi:MAG: NUDIX hydrolase [Alphaproteobacteria bacterium]|nr:NUDIX hydrolase [Alphaproteobacteria bacterium]
MAREYPQRPILAVGAVIWRGDHVLLVRRGNPPRANEWSIPGGAQELGETVREALHREVREETHVSIAIEGLADVVDAIIPDEEGRPRHHYTLLDFAARWTGGEAKPGDDVAETVWAHMRDLDRFALWDATRRVILKSRGLLR